LGRSSTDGTSDEGGAGSEGGIPTIGAGGLGLEFMGPEGAIDGVPGSAGNSGPAGGVVGSVLPGLVGITGNLSSVPPAGKTAGTSEAGGAISGGRAGARTPVGTEGIAGKVSSELGGGISLGLVAGVTGDIGKLARGMNSAGRAGSSVSVGPVRGGVTGASGAEVDGSETSACVAAVGCSLIGQRSDTAAIPAARLHTAAAAIVSCFRENAPATQPRKVLLPGAGGASPAVPFPPGFSGGFAAPVGPAGLGAAGLAFEMIFPETSIGMASVIRDLP
jgi:hypothetical protein